MTNEARNPKHEEYIRHQSPAFRTFVFRLFVRQGLALAGLGVGLGAIGARAAAPVLSSLLIGVTASDPPRQRTTDDRRWTSL